MKWIIITIVLSFFALFAPLYYLFAQDALQLNPLSLSQSIISNLQQLRQLNLELMSEANSSKEQLKIVDQKLEASENLVKQLSMLVDDQVILYRTQLRKLKACIAGLLTLIGVYNTLKAFLRLKYKIKIW